MNTVSAMTCRKTPWHYAMLSDCVIIGQEQRFTLIQMVLSNSALTEMKSSLNFPMLSLQLPLDAHLSHQRIYLF